MRLSGITPEATTPERVNRVPGDRGPAGRPGAARDRTAVPAPARSDGRRHQSGRRGNGDGTITRRRNGLWQGAVFVTTSHGTRRREYVYGRDREQVRDRVARLVAREAVGIPVPHERWTVADYLNHWLQKVIRPSRQPLTYQGYESVVRRHLVPAIG